MNFVEGNLSKAKAYETSRMMCLLGDAFLEGSKTNLAPCFALSKIYRGANSGSTWGWLLLEGIKNSENRSLE